MNTASSVPASSAALAAVLVATTDATGTIAYVNPQTLEFTGQTTDFLRTDWLSLIHPDDQQRAAEAWQQAQQQRRPYQVEYRLHHHDGDYRWMRSSSFPQLAPDGAVQQWIVTSIDVEMLRQTGGADDFSFLVELIPQLVWTTDPTGFHTYFNQRWTDFTGYTLADSVGPDMWNNLLHPDDRQRARQVWGHSLATGEFYEIEYRFKARDGSYRWFLGQALPVRNADGELVKWFGTCTDIHDQKMQEFALRKREQDFTTLANAIPQLAWMADESGHIFWFNNRWFAYTGANPAESENQNSWEYVHHPDYLRQVQAKFQEAIQTGESWEDTFPLRRHDGEYRWFLSRALPVRDENEQIVRWCGTHTDVTEQKQLQEQLERSYSDLETKVMFRTLDLEREVQELRQQLGK